MRLLDSSAAWTEWYRRRSVGLCLALQNGRVLDAIGLCDSLRRGAETQGIVFHLESQEVMERTLVLLKPDCVQRRLMGAVIRRFEEKGLNILAMKMMHVTPDLAKEHYAEHVDKPFYPGLEAFITGAPVVAMVVEGLEVIGVIREMVGATSGLKAAAGTIRGDLSSSRQMNLVHASDGDEAAQREIGLYFRPEEICSYEPTLIPWLKAGDEA